MALDSFEFGSIERIKRNSWPQSAYSRSSPIRKSEKSGSSTRAKGQGDLDLQRFAWKLLMRRVQRQSKTSQGNSCRFVDLGRPKRWFLGRQGNFRAFSKADALEGNKDIHVDATSWSTEKLILNYMLDILNFKDHVTYGFAKTIFEAIAHVTDKTSQDSVGDAVGWNFWSGNSHFGRVFLQESVQTLSSLKVYDTSSSKCPGFHWLCDPPWSSFQPRESSLRIECAACWCSGPTVDYTQFGQVWSSVLMSFQDKPGTKQTNHKSRNKNAIRLK